MESTTSTEDPRIKQFRGDYFETIRLFRIPESTHPWYRKHLEHLVKKRKVASAIQAQALNARVFFFAQVLH